MTTAADISRQHDGKLKRPFGWAADLENERRDLNEWFYAEWLKLLAERNARERAIENKFYFGKAA